MFEIEFWNFSVKFSERFCFIREEILYMSRLQVGSLDNFSDIIVSE